MNILDKLKQKAKQNLKKIVLPEATDIRVLTAAVEINSEKIAIPVLIGDEQEIIKIATDNNINISGIQIINPENSEWYPELATLLYDLRKEKGLDKLRAEQLAKDSVYFGMLMVKQGIADGLVSGAIHSTADTLRPALQIIKPESGQKIVSSFFLMNTPYCEYGKQYIFADCGLNADPTAEELATIAIQSAKTYKELIGEEPCVALLSYSTYSSAKSESVEKVQCAKKILDDLHVDFAYDGELQLDAALDEAVGKRKAPESAVSGKANILIFPNLDAGNIGYKLVERFSKADAIGPLTQGLAKPVNDLSRGCKASDIVTSVAITALQAAGIKKV